VVTVWFDEHENGVNHMPMAISVIRSQKQLNTSRAVPETTFYTTTIKKTPHQIENYCGRMVLLPSNRDSDIYRIYAKRCIKAVLAARGAPNALFKHFMLVFPLFWQVHVCHCQC
jgi:hypothetical protein